LIAAFLYVLAVTIAPTGTLHELLINLSLAVVIPAGVTLIWALMSGRWLADEVMELVGITSELRRAGLKGAKSFKDLDWDELFQAGGQLDVWAAWAGSWAMERNPHRLRALVARKNARLRVLLPDPDDDQNVGALCRLFPSRDSEYVRAHINEVIRFYSEELAPHASSTCVIEVWVTTFLPVYSCYIFNETRAVLAPMTHTPSPDYVPAFVLGSGEFLDHVLKELKFVREQKSILRFTSVAPRT
jgi:hypothetical protein